MFNIQLTGVKSRPSQTSGGCKSSPKESQVEKTFCAWSLSYAATAYCWKLFTDRTADEDEDDEEGGGDDDDDDDGDDDDDDGPQW